MAYRKPMRPLIVLTDEERRAAIRAYNSKARDSLERGAMVDAIIDAINRERTTAPDYTREGPMIAAWNT